MDVTTLVIQQNPEDVQYFNTLINLDIQTSETGFSLIDFKPV